MARFPSTDPPLLNSWRTGPSLDDLWHYEAGSFVTNAPHVSHLASMPLPAASAILANSRPHVGQRHSRNAGGDGSAPTASGLPPAGALALDHAGGAGRPARLPDVRWQAVGSQGLAVRRYLPRSLPGLRALGVSAAAGGLSDNGER